MQPGERIYIIFPLWRPLSKLKPERVVLVVILYFIQAKSDIGETWPKMSS